MSFTALPAFAQRSSRVPTQQTALTADKLLALGDFYLRKNDITDAADRYYRQAIQSSPRSQAAGYAQFNRGQYWFRKYYLLREQFSKEDRSALSQAEGQFYDFINKFAEPNNVTGLLSDAEFYLALVYLQEGKRNYASGWLNRMLSEAVDKDRLVNIYKVIWTSNAADIVDRNVDAKQLALLTRQLIDKGLSFTAVVSEVKRWCQRQ
jgi:tetratricopeptide (TPR) repeat protein